MFKLTKHQRLKKPADFQRVYKSKQWGGSQYFTFNILAAESARVLTNSLPTKKASTDLKKNNQAILGVTVSKKVSNRAVDRNRIKRQIREFFRLHQAELYGANLVITAKANCIKASDEQRAESLVELWGKIMKWQRWYQHQQANTTVND